MTLKTPIRWTTLAMATAGLMLAGCNGGGSSSGGSTTGSTTGGTTGGTTGSSTTGGSTGGLTGGLTGGSSGGAVGSLFISFDAGGEQGSVDTYAADLSARTASFNTGLNEGIFANNGKLTAVGLVGGIGSIRRFPNFATRGNGAYDTAQDDEYLFNAIKAPHGAAFAGLGGNALIVADAPAAVNGEDLSTVPSLHFLTSTLGLTQPLLLYTQTVSVAQGRTWDVAYDGIADRLYAAMTNGVINVYDTFGSRALTASLGGPAVAPSRTITPGAINGGNSAKISVNLHGIAFNRASNQLVVSDVGQASSDSDGSLFVIDNASTASDSVAGSGPAVVVPSRVIAGASTLLGNPVDVLLRSDGKLYVAEKANGGGQILVFNDVLIGTASGNIAPDQHVTTASLGSTGTPESIAEPN